MENYENTPFETESSQPVPQPPVNADGSYRNAGAGHRESPFANSPYEMPHQPRKEFTGYTPGYIGGSLHTEPKKPKAPKKQGSFLRSTISLVLVVALIAGGCMITAYTVNQKWEQQSQRTMDQMNRQISDLQKQIDTMSQNTGTSVSGSAPSGSGLTPGQVYAQNVDSVVAISSSIQSNSFYGTAEGTATGSGFILTEDGYIITNHHVIEGATHVTVVSHDGTEYEAAIIGSDSGNDVAVLKVEAAGLPAAVIGSSDDLIIGDMVVAIGNPLGTLTATQTVGYVSGKDRDVSTDNSIINMI